MTTFNIDDVDLSATVGMKKALSRGLSVLSMFSLEYFAPTCGDSFEEMLRCLASDPEKLLLADHVPKRLQALLPAHQPTQAIEQQVARLLLDLISHKHRLALLQAATSGDQSLVAGCAYALQTLRDMISFSNGRTAVAALLDAKLLETIA